VHTNWGTVLTSDKKSKLLICLIIKLNYTLKGFELAVLETIPWDKVDIQVLDVETDLAGLLQKGKNLPI
jgi:hypothetical protein